MMYPPKTEIYLLHSFHYKEILTPIVFFRKCSNDFFHNYFSRISNAYRTPMKFVLISKSVTKVCLLIMG